jgi:hypothetical protein
MRSTAAPNPPDRDCHHDPDESAPSWCSCPVMHPRLARLLAPVSGLLPGRMMGWVLGEPCWATRPDGTR